MTRSGGFSWPRLVFARRAGDQPPAADPQARFRDAILPHLDAAYRYARYLSRDQAGAEDIVQDAIVRALKAIDQCRSNPKSWLLAIVRHCHIDWARANGRYVPLDLVANADEEGDAPDGQIERTDAALDLRKVIESLPEPFRASLVLRELEELSYREIAEITAVPIGTVMSRLARARQMLAVLVLSDEDKEARAR